MSPVHWDFFFFFITRRQLIVFGDLERFAEKYFWWLMNELADEKDQWKIDPWWLVVSFLFVRSLILIRDLLSCFLCTRYDLLHKRVQATDQEKLDFDDRYSFELISSKRRKQKRERLASRYPLTTRDKMFSNVSNDWCKTALCVVLFPFRCYARKETSPSRLRYDTRIQHCSDYVQ